MQIYYCDNCSARVTEENIRSGGAVLIEDSCFCAECAAEISGVGTVQAVSDADFIVEEVDLGLDDQAQAAGRERPRRPASSSRRMRYPQRSHGSPALLLVAFGGGVLIVLAIALTYFAFKSPAGPAVQQPEPPPTQYVEPVPAPRAEKPEPKPPGPAPSVRRPLGENLPTPDVKPVERPDPPKPPAPKPTTPEPEYKPAPVPAGWLQVFNGRDMKGWRKLGGRDARVEDGALVSVSDADLYYAADWSEFVLECEVKGERGPGGPDTIMGIGLGQWRGGRGSSRALAYIHFDGDMHVYIERKRAWKSGGGRFPPAQWTKTRFEVTRDSLKVHRQGELMTTLALPRPAEEAQKGGLYFFAFTEGVARLRNVRVKVLSR